MRDTTLKSTSFLRLALLADAAASGVTGLLLATAAGPLAGIFGLPEPLLRGAGLILLPYAAIVAWVGTRDAPSHSFVRAIIAVNLLWVADSVLLLALGPALVGLNPTALGIAFTLFQAAAVLGLAIAQAVALRRAKPAEAATAFA